MLNGMPEGAGGREEGYVPVAGGAKGSIQKRVQNLLMRNSHPVRQ